MREETPIILLISLLITSIIILVVITSKMHVEKTDIVFHQSAAMSHIQKECGIYNSDLLWTTAMEKIAKCIDERGNE